MQEKIKVYISVPMTGCYPEEVTNHIAVVAGFLNGLGYETILPQLAGTQNPGVPLLANLYDLNTEVYAARRNDVRKCDILFADLTGADIPSLGCAMEIAWAKEWGKRVVVAAGMENPHRHVFVLASADKWLDTRWQAFRYFEDARKDAQVPCDDTDVPSRPEIDPEMFPKEGER